MVCGFIHQEFLLPSWQQEDPGWQTQKSDSFTPEK